MMESWPPDAYLYKTLNGLATPARAVCLALLRQVGFTIRSQLCPFWLTRALLLGCVSLDVG